MTRLTAAAGIALAATLALAPATSNAQEAEMTIDTQSYIQRFKAVFSNPGDASISALFTSDMTDHAPWPGHTPDLAGFESGLAEMREAFPDLRVSVEQTVAQGDVLAVQFTVSGTQLGEFMGAPASGKTFSVEAMDMVRLVDGRIAEHWGVMDAAAMAEQLGL